MNREYHCLTRVLQTTRSSGSVHISFEPSPVHSFTLSNHGLAGLPIDLSPSNVPCKIVFVMQSSPFACPNYVLPRALINKLLHQHVILPSVQLQVLAEIGRLQRQLGQPMFTQCDELQAAQC